MRKARREKCKKCGEPVAKGRMRIHMLSHTEMAELFAELRTIGFSASVAGRIATEKLIEQSVQRREGGPQPLADESTEPLTEGTTRAAIN
jgi:hypothetical protein